MPLIELLIEDDKTPTLNNREAGGMWILLCVSTILSPVVSLDEKAQKLTEKKAFDQDPSLTFWNKIECFPGPYFAIRELASSPGLLFLEHSPTTRIRLTRLEIYSGNHLEGNQFGRWVRLDLKTEQGFCCRCRCHLKQSAFQKFAGRRKFEF